MGLKPCMYITFIMLFFAIPGLCLSYWDEDGDDAEDTT